MADEDDAGQSCLVEKLSYYIKLSDRKKSFIASLEEDERCIARGDQIRHGGERIDYLHVVKSGRLYSCTILAGGRRQVLKLHFRGDIIGLPDLAFEHATTGLQTVADAVLCPFPKRNLDDILTQSPTMTALLMTIGMVD